MWRLIIVPVLAVIVFAASYFYFYTGSGYSAPPSPEAPVAHLTAPVSTVGDFEDRPRISRGTLVVDGLHGNNTSREELSAFLSLVAGRGYEVKVLGESARFGGFLSSDPSDSFRRLEEELRGADSLLVAVPQDRYSPEEVDLVEEFVARKGGKLLMIGDTTRRHELNTLAGRFGVSFQPDYLFNTVEYDLNFQNVIVRDFLPGEITRGVGQISLYSTSSVKGPGPGLAVADGNTRSSMSESPGPFYPLVQAGDDRALALGDLTFMVPPRNSVLDNNRLLANIADFLTESEREFTLSDFPHFFRGGVDILLGRPELLDLASGLGEDISNATAATATAAPAEASSRDAVFLGLYDDAPEVAQYLQLAGVQLDGVNGIDGRLRTPFTAGMDTADTGVILLHATDERRVLVALADSQESLDGLVSQLRSGGFRAGLVGDFVGVYRFK